MRGATQYDPYRHAPKDHIADRHDPPMRAYAQEVSGKLGEKQTDPKAQSDSDAVGRSATAGAATETDEGHTPLPHRCREKE